jgi:uncharacterized membrane protein
LIPSFKISAFEGLARRLRRNYAFIYLVILVAWITKIFLHAKPPITGLVSFYKAMSVGTSIPGWLVASIFSLTFLMVVGTTIWVAFRSSGEFTDFGPRRNWKI